MHEHVHKQSLFMSSKVCKHSMRTDRYSVCVFASCMKRRRMKTTCKGDVEEKAHGGGRWRTSHSFIWISALKICLLQCSFSFVFCWSGVGTVMNSYKNGRNCV